MTFKISVSDGEIRVFAAEGSAGARAGDNRGVFIDFTNVRKPLTSGEARAVAAALAACAGEVDIWDSSDKNSYLDKLSRRSRG